MERSKDKLMGYETGIPRRGQSSKEEGKLKHIYTKEIGSIVESGLQRKMFSPQPPQ